MSQRIRSSIIITTFAASGWLLAATAVQAAPCESLTGLKFNDATVTLAQTVAAGAMPAPAGGRGGGNPFADLPAFCRVAATLRPSADSDIKIEVWMPASGWNGKFQAVGNGGWAGTISYPGMATVLARGYATASTDTGHASEGGAFVIGHREKYVDFAY